MKNCPECHMPIRDNCTYCSQICKNKAHGHFSHVAAMSGRNKKIYLERHLKTICGVEYPEGDLI